MSPFLIATANRAKLCEVRAILSGLPVRIATLDDYPGLAKPHEDAATFEGNARLKALHYARLTGLWTLADDSGLEVDALGGLPGVRSARYSTPAGRAGQDSPHVRCNDAANNAKLVEQLAGTPPEKRTARFRCVVALANPEEVLGTASGVVEGMIVDEPRGVNGFGYDPHFFVPQFGMTTAEMSPEQKNRISHRGRALRAIQPLIQRALASSA